MITRPGEKKRKTGNVVGQNGDQQESGGTGLRPGKKGPQPDRGALKGEKKRINHRFYKGRKIREGGGPMGLTTLGQHFLEGSNANDLGET